MLLLMFWMTVVWSAVYTVDRLEVQSGYIMVIGPWDGVKQDKKIDHVHLLHDGVSRLLVPLEPLEQRALYPCCTDERLSRGLCNGVAQRVRSGFVDHVAAAAGAVLIVIDNCGSAPSRLPLKVDAFNITAVASGRGYLSMFWFLGLVSHIVCDVLLCIVVGVFFFFCVIHFKSLGILHLWIGTLLLFTLAQCHVWVSMLWSANARGIIPSAGFVAGSLSTSVVVYLLRAGSTLLCGGWSWRRALIGSAYPFFSALTDLGLVLRWPSVLGALLWLSALGAHCVYTLAMLDATVGAGPVAPVSGRRRSLCIALCALYALVWVCYLLLSCLSFSSRFPITGISILFGVDSTFCPLVCQCLFECGCHADCFVGTPFYCSCRARGGGSPTGLVHCKNATR